jgi:hypothetical protein
MTDAKRFAIVVSFVIALVTTLLAPPAAVPAQFPETGQTRMVGFQEVPVVLTGGQGRFAFRVRNNRIDWELQYATLDGSVTQAHIHIGQPGVNGAIATFLCSNLGNGPAGTQGCPAAPSSIQGTIEAEDILAVAAQGLTAGDLARFVTALRAGSTYANIHSTLYPGGEVRGQIKGQSQQVKGGQHEH